ncbi:hypothetical protein CPB83DRAFT_863431 [Crepidotus variabilis]|uniref:Uncharacterized protein n=1 Tax=Crepidotus variabilis TaxID=179855 RepID=A0A9P6E5U8_9AGAR|nr:hypothetical protein CPB83DRAFT_863431 [Crepidotus variabilis]
MKKLTPGVEATTHRIEASRVVLNTLERTKVEEEIQFLNPAAENALGLLQFVRGIEEGEVDDDFAALALDSCGLVFVLISECDKLLNAGEEIPERFRWGSGELAEFLKEDVQVFVQKKIKRGFLSRRLRHVADDEKVVKHRERLAKWLVKLGIQPELSIHDAVDSIISEKVSRHDQDVQAARRAGKPLSQSRTPTPLSQLPSLNSTISIDKMHKPLPEIQVWQTTSTSPIAPADSSSSRSASLDIDNAKQKRLEAERLARKAEKEMWRKAEAEFNKLPVTPLRSSTPLTPLRAQDPSRPSHSRSVSIQEVSRPPSVASVLKPLRRDSDDLPAAPTSPPHDEAKDRELAAQLQSQLAKEVAEEDERKAHQIAASLQRQWEAEHERPRRSKKDRSRSRSRPSLRDPGESSSDESILTPERKKVLAWIKSNARHSPSPTGSPQTSRSGSPNPVQHRREYPPAPIGPVPLRRASLAFNSTQTPGNTAKPSAPLSNL